MNILKVSILIFSLFFLACGRKAPPLPIEKSIPKNPELEIEATPLGLNLWITLPEKTIGGLPLNKIKALIIDREEISLESSKTLSKVSIKLKPKLHSAGRVFLYTDTDLKEKTCYIYRLRIEKDFLVSTPFTEGERACWTTPPKPPKGISIHVDSEGSTILKWTPPDIDLKGAPLIGKLSYKIIKYSDHKITSHEVADSTFIDHAKGFKICYRIQTVLHFHGTSIPSPLSELICIN